MDEEQRTPLFPEFPADLTSLDENALSALIDEGKAASQKVLRYAVTDPDARIADPSFLGTRSADEIHAEMEAGVSKIKEAQAALAAIKAGAETFAGDLTSLAAQIDPEETLAAETETVEETAEATAVEETAETAETTEAVVASAEEEKPQRILRRLPAAGRHTPVPAAQFGQGRVLTASADIEGFRAGQPLNEEQLALAFRSVMRQNTTTPPGVTYPVKVARSDLKEDPSIPAFRRLDGDSIELDTPKIKALVAAAAEYGVTLDESALTASGGLCAPVTPYYQLANVSTVQRPVRDSLVGFIADRGGIRFAPPPVISQVTTAVGVVTAAQDLAGGSTGTKTCQTVICPPFTEVDVDSIYHCITAGNLGQRAFPEQIAQFVALVLAQHARVSDGRLLDHIKAGSTAVTGNTNAAELGATASLLSDILTAAAGIRSNNRMIQDSRLQVILPAWTADLLVQDIILSQFQRFQFNQAGVEALLNTFNIQVTWTLDGPSDGTAQVFGLQTAGAILPYPTSVQWAIFDAGHWLYVDSGVLELGIVRDSVLNATNSYTIFGETWESAAGIGVQSLWVTSDVCPNGAVALPLSTAGYCGS